MPSNQYEWAGITERDLIRYDRMSQTWDIAYQFSGYTCLFVMDSFICYIVVLLIFCVWNRHKKIIIL